MTEKEKLAMIEEMLELDTGALSPEIKLINLEEWDSIAVISFIALLDEEFNKIIKGCEIKEFKTVADILTVMNNG